MRYRVGPALLVLLGTIAPAWAQGPMSPVPLSHELPTEQAPVPVPGPVVQPPVAAPSPAISALNPISSGQVIAAPKKRVVQRGMPKPVEKEDTQTVTSKPATTEETAADASDAPRNLKGSRKESASDPDHMASQLNRMQLDRGYGASTPPPSARPVPLVSWGD